MNPLRVAALAAAVLPVFAQVPDQDARNTEIRGLDTHVRMPAYASRAAWDARKAELRKQILSAAGLLPMPGKTPLHAQVFGRIENGDYSVEKVLLETLPGYYLGGNLYRPLGKAGRFPGIASPHGHWNYGRLENQQLASIPARGINLARQGYVVMTYDMVGYNDTPQTPHREFGRTRREQIWSFGPLGLQLWNSIRVVDFLQSLPDVDPERIGATGASGGGTQTYLLAAVDDRVKFDAPVNMISAIYAGGCDCENAPNLRVDAINLEYGAMMAPRPMIMVCTTKDWTRNTPQEEFPAIQSIYKLYGAEDKIATVQIDAPHNYNQESREAVYRFFAKQVLGLPDGDKLKERNVHLPGLPELMVLHNRTPPANAVTFEQLFAEWIDNAKRQAEAPANELKERLALALMAQWPAKVESKRDGDRIWLTRPGAGDRVPGLFIAGKGTPVLIVDADGAEAARKSDAARRAIAAGQPVLLLDAFQTGGAKAPRDEKDTLFVSFNKTADANRVQDILTALAYLNPAGARVVGIGRAAVWCTFAAAVAPVRVSLDAEIQDFDGTDQDFTDKFFVPGIQRAGGLRAALAILN